MSISINSQVKINRDFSDSPENAFYFDTSNNALPVFKNWLWKVTAIHGNMVNITDVSAEPKGSVKMKVPMKALRKV